MSQDLLQLQGLLFQLEPEQLEAVKMFKKDILAMKEHNPDAWTMAIVWIGIEMQDEV
jgi:hypothetical protein